MKKNLFFLAALGAIALTSCSDDTYLGENTGPNDETGTAAINFNFNVPNTTRAGEFKGATAAEKLGGMFVVEGTKGSEKTNSPSDSVVFDNYLVGYTYNSAGTTESNTNNWEYVGLQSGITGRLLSATWNKLHEGATDAKSQTIKYWDYSHRQYDFIAWSTGTCEAVPVPASPAEPATGKIQVSRIAHGSALSTSGFTMRASSADDLLQCYYTDIQTVTKASGKYGQPVTLTFRNMAAKVRVALYETVPGYSVENVKFYSSDANPTAPTDLGTGTSTTATLFTMGDDILPKSGTVTVKYPRIGTTYRDAGTRPVDYNKASVTVEAGASVSTTQDFGTLSNQYRDSEGDEPSGTKLYLGKTITAATYAGDKDKSYYTAVIPNTNGKPLTLRVDYTLVSTDGSKEKINVYGAKAVVPATYTNWLPNYAYTYIFKISDNSNGWTSTVKDDPKGLFPITFDAVVTSFTDANAEQATVTTVATPSITTYQQGHDHANKDEYSRNQTAGASSEKKDLYVQVMNTDGSASPLVTGLDGTNSLLYSVSDGDASEAEVMDALQNRTNAPTGSPAKSLNADNPVGRNTITLTKDATHISNTITQIVNGVDDQPITVSSGTAAKIDIDQLATGTYAYVYCKTVPSTEERLYNLVSSTEASSNVEKYYEVALAGDGTDAVKAALSTAVDGKVYFIINKKADGSFDSYTFKQTKVGDDVSGLVEANIPAGKATVYTAGHFYFDVYYQNDGEYAVKVFKVVE